jgi:hypothetical protein
MPSAAGWAKSPAPANDTGRAASRDFAHAVKRRGRTTWTKVERSVGVNNACSGEMHLCELIIGRISSTA